MQNMIRKINARRWVCIAAMGSTAVAAAAVHEVEVGSNFFSPNQVTIEAGDTVRWTNNSGDGHNVVSYDNVFRCAEGCDGNGGNGDVSTSWVAEVTFHSPDTYGYFCAPHEVFGMTGNVQVDVPTSTTVHEVQALGDNSFSPAKLTINVGDVVRFRNINGPHNVRAADDSFRCSEGCEGDGTLLDADPTGFPWDVYVRFDQVGDVAFYCEEHEFTGTGGVVHVVDPGLIFANGFD